MHGGDTMKFTCKRWFDFKGEKVGNISFSGNDCVAEEQPVGCRQKDNTIELFKADTIQYRILGVNFAEILFIRLIQII